MEWNCKKQVKISKIVYGNIIEFKLKKLPYSWNPCFQLQVQIIASTCFDNRQLIYLFKILEPMLKAYSDAIVVIGILSKSRAIIDKYKKCWLLLFHHSRASIGLVNEIANVGSSKYMSSWFFLILIEASSLRCVNS